MEKRIGIMIGTKKEQEVQQTKDVFQSVSYLYHDFINPMTSTLYGQFDFEQFLIDSNGHYWFTEKTMSGKETSQIFVFNGRGALIKNIVVKGKPTLYEFDNFVIVACEGTDNHSYIYQYCKTRIHLIMDWTIDGFLWDLECVDGALYITSYLPSINEAVLYIIDENRKKAIDLGTGVFPSGIIHHQGKLLIAFSFIYSGSKGKITKYDLDGNVIEEFTLKVAPRQLFTYNGKIVLHGLDMAKGSADRLVYVNVENGNRTSYRIPNSTDIRPQGKHMLLHNRETESVLYWSHEKRRIIRVVHLPLKIPTKTNLDKIHWSI